MSGLSCMGGWCAERKLCALYDRPGHRPVERLCEPGRADSFEPAPAVIRSWPAGATLNTDPLNAVFMANR